MTVQYQGSQPDTRPTSGLAITSLVLGILGLCLGPLAIVPLILGIIGITQTGTNGPRKGKGFAIAGTALGGVGIMGSCLSIGILLPALGKAKQQANKLRSMTHVRSIVQAAVVYSTDHEDQFPGVDQWPDAVLDLGLLDPEILVSPVEDGDGVSYIYLGGWNSFDAQQIVVYEDPKHFAEGVIVGFADAHVEIVDHATFERMLQEQLSNTEP
jgi:hypothetical protein